LRRAEELKHTLRQMIDLHVHVPVEEPEEE
jgi:hypothetical protein